MAATIEAKEVNSTALLTIDAGKPGAVISKHLYGHFAEHLGRCIYDGLWVGPDSKVPNIKGYRKDIVEALRAIKIPNLRWPGGCFADQYHWKEGVGPKGDRPEMINMHWGMVTEDNSFGTHEFLDFCELIGAEPYLAGNVGSGEVQELADWVEYTNRESGGDMASWRKKNGRTEQWKVKYWGIGNENWGCGGNMSPERYADEFRRYATFVMDYGKAAPYRVACGANGDDYRWTEVMMANVRPLDLMDGLSLHYYTFTGSWREKGSATSFTNAEYMENLHRVQHMDTIIATHSRIMDRYDPQRRIGLLVDEWGNWWDAEKETNPRFLYQQNTMRDAITASLALNIFNSHAERVKMANIAQLVNVLQALILTEDEKMILTPTYHVFDLYQIHQEAKLLPVQMMSPDYTVGDRTFPALSVSASLSESGHVNLTFCHTDPDEALEVSCTIPGLKLSTVEGRVLTAKSLSAHNTFDDPDEVTSRPFEGATIEKGLLHLKLPALSVTALELK